MTATLNWSMSITGSPSTTFMNPPQTTGECATPEPKFHAPLISKPPSTVLPIPLGNSCPALVTRSPEPKTSSKPSSGR